MADDDMALVNKFGAHTLFSMLLPNSSQRIRTMKTSSRFNHIFFRSDYLKTCPDLAWQKVVLHFPDEEEIEEDFDLCWEPNETEDPKFCPERTDKDRRLLSFQFYLSIYNLWELKQHKQDDEQHGLNPSIQFFVSVLTNWIDSIFDHDTLIQEKACSEWFERVQLFHTFKAIWCNCMPEEHKHSFCLTDDFLKRVWGLRAVFIRHSRKYQLTIHPDKNQDPDAKLQWEQFDKFKSMLNDPEEMHKLAADLAPQAIVDMWTKQLRTAVHEEEKASLNSKIDSQREWFESQQEQEIQARQAAEQKQKEEAEARQAAEQQQKKEADARQAAEQQQKKEADARQAAEQKLEAVQEKLLAVQEELKGISPHIANQSDLEDLQRTLNQYLEETADLRERARKCQLLESQLSIAVQEKAQLTQRLKKVRGEKRKADAEIKEQKRKDAKITKAFHKSIKAVDEKKRLKDAGHENKLVNKMATELRKHCRVADKYKLTDNPEWCCVQDLINKAARSTLKRAGIARELLATGKTQKGADLQHMNLSLLGRGWQQKLYCLTEYFWHILALITLRATNQAAKDELFRMIGLGSNIDLSLFALAKAAKRVHNQIRRKN
jgi:hypothetical protein